MIRTILLSAALLIQYSLSGQNQYYDAIELKRYSQITDDTVRININVKRAREILADYFPEGTEIDSIDWNGNPFIASGSPQQGELSIGKSISKAFQSLGGVDVTSFARGTAQFLIERANEEINILFFEKFKEFLNDNEEASTLFPSSTYFITNTKPSQYSILLQVFRDAFKKDIKNITNQLDDLLQLDRYRTFGKDHPEAYAGLAALASTALLLGDGTAPDVISSLGKFDNPSSSVAINLYASIKLMSVLSESIRSKEHGEAWIKSSDFDKNIIQDPLALKIYFGLIYQKVDGIKFKLDGDEKGVQEILLDAKDANNRLEKIVEYFKKIESGWSKIHAELEGIKKKKNGGNDVPYMEYYSYVNDNLDLIEEMLKVDGLLKSISNGEINIQYPSEVNSYLRVLRTGNEIYRDVNEENYSAAIVNLVIVYEKIIGSKIENKFSLSKKEMKSYLSKKDNFESESDFLKSNTDKGSVKKKYKKHIVSMYEGDLGDLNAEFKRLAKENGIGIDNDKFLKYASFMAAMIETESPEEVKSLIKAAALPAGSFTIKKNSKFNISVQSYLGVYYNTDYDRSISNSWNNKWGLTAPIGVSFNLGLGNNSKSSSSLGFMISLLDIGAVVDYEIRADTVTTTTVQGSQTTTTKEISNTSADFKIELGQIFSPGGYLVYSLPGRLPFTLGLGAQYGPGLTEINISSGNTDLIIGKPSWRMNAFLAFDIPLFTIANKDK